MMCLNIMLATLSWLEFVSPSPLVLALGVACIFVVVAIPYAASRGQLHIPGYVGLALASFIAAFILGRISGTKSVHGTHTGLGLAIACFLLAAVAVGSVIALFFYRDRAEP
jgi:hypothetical protein